MGIILALALFQVFVGHADDTIPRRIQLSEEAWNKSVVSRHELMSEMGNTVRAL